MTSTENFQDLQTTIRVLHFVSTPAIWSGVMSVIMNYYRNIERSKVQFDFLCFSPCKAEDESYEGEILRLGGHVYFIAKPSLSPVFFREIHSFFRMHGNEYTWVHNHEIYMTFFLRPLVSRYGIKNFAIHCHATRYSDRFAASLRNRILCFPIRFMRSKPYSRLERLACSSSAGLFLYGKNRFSRRQIWTLPNAVNPVSYRFSECLRIRLRKRLGVPERAFVVGHIGRFVPQKNHKFLIHIFKAIIAVNPEAYLFLIGDGPLFDSVNRQVREEALEKHVFFLGQRPDIPELLNGMDVFVLPSRYEGLPVSVIEACANGLPCVISETISNDIPASPWLTRLSLKEPAEVWAGAAMKAEGRHPYFPKLYDVRHSAKELKKFYMEKGIISCND